MLSTTTKNTTVKISNTPHFEAENILIYKDDILKISAIPNNSVDLIVTSPPYNDITKQEFMDWTNGVWTFNGQSKKGYYYAN